ncbi:MAG: hypothetical protein AAGJ94_13245 [Pseudomonadota bacterium]
MLNLRKAVAVVAAVLSLTFVGSNFLVPDFRGYDDSLYPIPVPDPLVVPAAYAFIIWGPIFIWLILSLFWALFKRSDDAQWHATRLSLIVSLVVGTFWLPVAVASPVWASVMICIMLGGAVVALYRSPKQNPLLGAWPIGLYAGWLSAACCVSVSVVLTGYGVLPESVSAVLFIVLSISIGFMVQWTLRRAPTYGVAINWALIAIAVDTYGRNELIAYLAMAGVVLVSLPTLRSISLINRGAD